MKINVIPYIANFWDLNISRIAAKMGCQKFCE